jgi:hypothetical protein
VRIKKRTVAMAVVVAGIAWVTLAALRFAGGLDHYCGVYRTDDRKEVLYRLGAPTSVIGAPVDGWAPVYTPGSTDPKQAIPTGKSESDFPSWGYNPDNDTTVTVEFTDTNGVDNISCMTGHARGCPMLAGVAFDDTEEEVIRKLGRHHARYMLNGVSKRLRYDDIGVEFLLTKDRVYTLTLLGQRPPLYATLHDYILSLPGRLMPY